ncbi:MAG TPA: phosphatidate cytidylyltransferase [Thermoclostridium caenicola]|uniref:phosphatidate cytidylyltransferase n=1 Tax=Thermoclostridium caenicola TaxID=659425 RepID=UPI002C184E1A|nr:phosphatidate cytidylyltransferase [Thermoclostridium caenicola]HOK43695.1 phosphatidate cytidylyltransferase [Thermoclostridium caenicola]HOL83889.1 phosphatidate cytidylyltransferase [Thermoclostridium caenicola]HPO75624.1 phosphatidate cytidylyltransferase [Thermoclostridium caenicola]
MLTRIISGVVAAAVLVAILLLPPVFLAGAVLLVSCIGLHEYAGAMKHKGIRVDLKVSWAAALVWTAYAYVTTLAEQEGQGLAVAMKSLFTRTALWGIIFLIVVVLFSRILFENGKFRTEDAAHTLFGIIYIPFLLSFVLMIRNMDRGFEYIWLVIIGASVTDIFAYFAGTMFGRHKIIPAISPKKTVEGAIGGALGCMICMMVYGVLVVNRSGTALIPVFHFALMGMLCGVLSQIGDWAASSIKRSAGIKDFGRLLPGHGGMMDRCDSFLFVAPVVYIYISLFF